MIQRTRKIDALVGSEWIPFGYGDTFDVEAIRGGQRLRIGLDDDHVACIRELASALVGPYQLLYVLHTTRTDSELGRYESPELSAEQVGDFLARFGDFLSQDSRHDFWLRSHDDDATIVLDRHNIIYAYGPLATFESALSRLGIRRRALPRVPDPHVHHYHAEWDQSERSILVALPWSRSPLRDSDVQWKDRPTTFE